MGKISYREKLTLPFWCSGNADNFEIRYIRAGISFFEHPSVNELTHSEFRLLMLMIKAAGPYPEFTLPRSEYSPHLSPATFNNAKNGLIKKNFIEVAYSGKTTREPNKYRFAPGWKNKTNNKESGNI